MGNFTLELREVFEYTDDIGLSAYPIHDEAHRETLNKKIQDHYWYREIGVETIEQFRFNVRRRMNEIMPYFNQLYESEKIVFNPLVTTDMQTNSTGKSEQKSKTVSDTQQVTDSSGESDSSQTSGSGARTINSEYPQTILAGNGDYATNGNDARTNSTVSGHAEEVARANVTSDQAAETDAEATDENESRMIGYQGIPSDLIMSYRDSILNIDLAIIDNLNDMFLGIWNTDDEYTTPKGYYL